MSETTPPAGTRGAVDLSSVAGLTTPTAATAGVGAPGGTRPVAGPGRPPAVPAVPAGLVVEVDAATLQEALNRTLQVPGVLVLWSSAHPQTRELVDTVIRVAASLGGRVLVLTADLSASPGAAPGLPAAARPGLRAAQSVPATFGLLQGQPVPLFPGVQPEAEVRAVLDQLLQAAVQNGITGRVELARRSPGPRTTPCRRCTRRPSTPSSAATSPRPRRPTSGPSPQDPKDHDAELGLAQVQPHAAHPGRRPRRGPRRGRRGPLRRRGRDRRRRPRRPRAATSRTPSPACSTSCARRAARTATGSAPTSSSCSPSSGTTTSACARAARR